MANGFSNGGGKGPASSSYYLKNNLHPLHFYPFMHTGQAIASPCTTKPSPAFRWIYDPEARLFMNAAGAARGLMPSESYLGDGCLNTAVDFWSDATVLATEGRSATTPTWTWIYKGMGVHRKASTGKVTGNAPILRLPLHTCWSELVPRSSHPFFFSPYAQCRFN